jgi:hypothetical protein
MYATTNGYFSMPDGSWHHDNLLKKVELRNIVKKKSKIHQCLIELSWHVEGPLKQLAFK